MDTDLRRILGPSEKNDKKVTKEKYIDVHKIVYFSRNIIRVTKSRKTKLTIYVARIGI
jgi:hypothetical protein